MQSVEGGDVENKIEKTSPYATRIKMLEKEN